MQVKYLNPGMFLLCRYRYIFFYIVFYIAVFITLLQKRIAAVQNSNVEIVLEICSTPNPTLNLPDSVNKCKNVLVDATVSFQLPYMQI